VLPRTGKTLPERCRSRGLAASGVAGLLVLLTIPFAVADEPDPLETVDTFFDALASNDMELAATVMLEDGQLYGYVDDGTELRLVPTSISDYLKGMADRTDSLLERIWDARIIREGRLAMVWTPYDFYRNGDFHHCGVNSFNLIRTNDGWKIASVVYSVLRENCEPSPLGAPVFEVPAERSPD